MAAGRGSCAAPAAPARRCPAPGVQSVAAGIQGTQWRSPWSHQAAAIFWCSRGGVSVLAARRRVGWRLWLRAGLLWE